MTISDTSPFASLPTSWDVEYRMALSQLLDLRKHLRLRNRYCTSSAHSVLDYADLQLLIEQTEQLEIILALSEEPDVETPAQNS